MLSILAQVEPPAGFKEFAALVMYCVGSVTAFVALWKMLRPDANKTEISGQPLEIKAHAGSVSREELKQVHGRIERERKEIDANIARVEAVAEKRAERIEGKLDANTGMTSEMKGQLGQVNQTLHQLTAAVQNSLRDAARK